MKKLSLILMALLLCLALVACDGDGDDTTLPGDDTGNNTVVNECDVHTEKKLDAVAPTCTQTGLTEGLACAVCNKVLATQEVIPALPHDIAGGKCKVCDAEVSDSQGLEMILDNNGDYVVNGIGTCRDAQIVIPATHNGRPVVAISARAFMENDDIVQVVIPASVKTIGDRAFYGCESLVVLSLPDGLESIGEKAFMYCTALESVVIPDSVTSVYTGAFMACYSLEEATLGTGLTKIGDDVFAFCFELQVVDILSKISSIGDWAFFECHDLTTINFEGTDADWNALDFGKHWDESKGGYNVFCSNGKNVHKHIYGDWFATGAKCEMGRRCTICNIMQTKFEHDNSTATWTFTSEGVISKCKKCGNNIDAYVKSDVVLQLDFDRPVISEIADFPYFTLVSDSYTSYEKDGDRTIWAVNNVTWLDYDKRAFEDLKYYSITFDIKFDGNRGDHARDISVISFIPGYKYGTQVGSSVAWNWQIKYLPVLGLLSTEPLNGQSIPYKTVEDIPDLSVWNVSNSFELPDGEWATVDIVCDVDAKTSYIFVNGDPVGTRPTFDYNDPNYGNAFSFRFLDFSRSGIKFDNFKIQAMKTD